jgi:hypothetical protein
MPYHAGIGQEMNRMLTRRVVRLALALMLAQGPLAGAVLAAEDGYRFDLRLEAGPTWQSRNKVQIPNDRNGTRFSLEDLAGDGPWAGVRATALWDINDRHGLRLMLAPLSYTEDGRFENDVDFANQRFSAGPQVEASYTFNSWRIGYRYRFYDDGPWKLWVGATAKVRDAEIRLQQGDTVGKDDDLGFVPLLYLEAHYRFNDRWSFAADFDGLAGGPGRALDLGLRLSYRVNDRLRLGLGYRGLEGGADTDDVYSFAWFNAVVLSARVRF